MVKTNLKQQSSNGKKILMCMMNAKCFVRYGNGLTCKDKWAPYQCISKIYMTTWQALDIMKNIGP